MKQRFNETEIIKKGLWRNKQQLSPLGEYPPIKFNYHLLEEFSSREVIKASDFIISGDSSLCYEAAIMGKKNTLRLYNEKYHPLYDADDGITIVKDPINLEKYLNKKVKIKNTSPKRIVRKFFFKYDKQAHIRLKIFLKYL